MSLKHPREDLLRSLRFSDKLLSGADEGLLAFDGDCRYIYWNVLMEQISGLGQAEVIGRCAFDLFPYLRETGEDECFRRALQGHTLVSRDRPYKVTATSRSGYYDAVYAPLERDDGAIAGGVAIVRETTERKRTEEQLRETELRFKNMADASPVLLWMSGADALCTYFNQTWLDFTGKPLGEELGVGWAEGVHFEDFQRCMDTYVGAFNERRVFEMEYRLRRADGEYRWILDRGAPRYSPDGEFAGYIGSCVDITERKHMEAELRRAVRDRDEFLSIASHELRTPVTTLQLQLDTLLRALEADGSEAQEPLTKKAVLATAQTHRLVRLINGLFDVSRISEGRLRFDPQPIDLAIVVRDVCARFRRALETARCELELRAPAAVRGRWDRLRLEQVVMNLLENAIKYGSGKPIEVAVEGDAECARLLVRDRGIGISHEDQARIFERFERAVSSRHYSGLGLGLWITKNVVEKMGGTIRVESAPNEGACFHISLPIS